VGRIGGGISVNAIPEDAWLEVDVRSSAPGALDRVEADMRAACAAAAREENARRASGTAPLTHTVRQIGDRPCGEVPADDPLVRLAIETTALTGRDAELAMASTDANVPISLGIPAIAIGGGGRGGDAHTRDEWYDNTSGSLGLARALTIVCAAAGLEAAY
jgi:acetylornithine deacetylase/succinyl-diaminopimelate desuccinylase-like protein